MNVFPKIYGCTYIRTDNLTSPPTYKKLKNAFMIETKKSYNSEEDDQEDEESVEEEDNSEYIVYFLIQRLEDSLDHARGLQIFHDKNPTPS